MSLARLLYLTGIVFMIWAIVSGIYVNFKMSNGAGSFTSGYTFKAGLFLFGLLLAYLGKRSKQ